MKKEKRASEKTRGQGTYLSQRSDANAPFLRATVNQVQSTFDLGEFRFGAGIFQSSSQNQLCRQLSRMDEGDRRLLLFMAQKMSRHVSGRQGGKA